MDKKQTIDFIEKSLNNTPSFWSKGEQAVSRMEIDGFFKTSEWYKKKYLEMGNQNIACGHPDPSFMKLDAQRYKDALQYQDTLSVIEKLKSETEDWILWGVVSTRLMDSGILSAALSSGFLCHELNSDNLPIMYNIASIYLLKGPKYFHQAHQWIQKLKKSNGNDNFNHFRAEIDLLLSELYVKDNKKEKAKKVLQEILTYDPRHAVALSNLSALISEEGQNKTALQIFEKRGNEVKNPHMKYNLAVLYFKDSNFPKALQIVELLLSNPYVQAICELMQSLRSLQLMLKASMN